MGLKQSEHDAICRALVDKGRLIGAGFETLRFQAIAFDAPPEQIEEMRLAFFAGAQHVFATINAILEPGAEPTAKDLKRMDAIAAELREFVDRVKALGSQAGGAVN